MRTHEVTPEPIASQVPKFTRMMTGKTSAQNVPSLHYIEVTRCIHIARFWHSFWLTFTSFTSFTVMATCLTIVRRLIIAANVFHTITAIPAMIKWYWEDSDLIRMINKGMSLMYQPILRTITWCVHVWGPSSSHCGYSLPAVHRLAGAEEHLMSASWPSNKLQVSKFRSRLVHAQHAVATFRRTSNHIYL